MQITTDIHTLCLRKKRTKFETV